MTAAKLHAGKVVDTVSVHSPYEGYLIGVVDVTDAAEIHELLARARRGAEISRNLPRHQRATILEGAAQIIESRRDAFAKMIVREAGKTIVQARKEVLRSVNTLKLSAEEAKRNAGEIVPSMPMRDQNNAKAGSLVSRSASSPPSHRTTIR